jgi:hypothetical protein
VVLSTTEATCTSASSFKRLSFISTNKVSGRTNPPKSVGNQPSEIVIVDSCCGFSVDDGRKSVDVQGKDVPCRSPFCLLHKAQRTDMLLR